MNEAKCYPCSQPQDFLTFLSLFNIYDFFFFIILLLLTAFVTTGVSSMPGILPFKLTTFI